MNEIILEKLEQKKTTIQHLLELRRRSAYVLLCFAILFLGFFIKAPELFHALVKSVLKGLPQHFITIQPAGSLFLSLKLAADAALILCTPYALFHLWQFASPALYQKEKKTLFRGLMLSILLFFSGVLFCFYLILPWMFQLFVQALPKEVQFMPDISYALDFITRMLLLFGLCFQVPLLCFMLVKLQWITLSTLKQIRPYVIVAAFIVGMLLTPPDVFSQITLAVPLCLLYELGILCGRYL